MVEPSSNWRAALRQLHDDAFEFDWDDHLANLNGRLRLTGRAAFSTPAPGLPPSWFHGDIDALEPRQWILVMSLNPAMVPDDIPWHESQEYTSESYWNHWRLLYQRYPELGYTRRFVDVARGLFQSEIADEAEFSARRLVFVELCPYSSQDVRLSPAQVRQLVDSDPGFRLAAQVRNVLISEGQPAAILINGVPAVQSFEATSGRALRWARSEYPSVDDGAKRLWHNEGFLAGEEPTLVAGTPFLRGPRTHNSRAELRQLGEQLREFASKHSYVLPAAP